MRKIISVVRSLLSIIGFVTILGVVLNIDSVQIWLAQPRLEVEILHWHGIRETSSFSGEVPVFDEFEMTLNIIPRVRFHPNQFPVNQVKGMSIRKGEWFGAYKADRKIPFAIRDEPVTLELVVNKIPIHGANSGKDVEVNIIDRWGRVSTASLENAF